MPLVAKLLNAPDGDEWLIWLRPSYYRSVAFLGRGPAGRLTGEAG